MPNLDEYLGRLPAEELADECQKRIIRWNDSLYRNGLINIWQRNYRLYYNADPYFRPNTYWNDFGVTGEAGEYLNIRVNHYRNLLTHMLNMIFSKLPALKSRAANTTPQAMESIDLCDAILEHDMHKKQINRQLKKAGEMALLFGTGAVSLEWDVNAGDPYLTDEMGRLISSGDVKCRAKSPLDFYTDTAKEDWNDVDWIVQRDFVNKYMLAAQFPDMTDKILTESDNDYIKRGIYFFDVNETDDIPVYKYYHRHAQGMLPNGRFCMWVNPNCVLYDGPNPYKKIPLFLVKPSEGLGTYYGYSPSFDLAPVQMFYNMVMSSIATNIAAHGVSNVVGTRGSDISVTQLVGGMNYIEVAPGMPPPQPLNLLSTAPEMYQISQYLERIMETVSGVNSVARGQPDSNLKSGVALGIVQSMAIQFMSGFQQSVINTLEDIGNFDLELNKTYANTPRVVSIVGKDKINEIRRWTAADISLVENIYIEPVDPFSQTLAGREARAENLLQKGLVNPQEYLTVATTGQLEPLYRRPMSELNYIRCENEKMINGEKVPVYITDNHPLHIDEHLTSTFDPDLRLKAQIPGSPEQTIMANLLEHVEQHKMAMQQQQMGGPMMPPGAPPQGPTPPQGQPQEPAMAGAGNQSQSMQLQAKMPESAPQPPTMGMQ